MPVVGSIWNYNCIDHYLTIAYSSPCKHLIGGTVMAKAKKTINYWTKQDLQQLRSLAKQGITGKVVAKKLKRSLPAVYMKASAEGIRFGR
jgi:hypothetical protein